ncbi:hypothetical protein [Alteromonas mediterranea]|uniref:hypothetical protein n=1 Tax=Alteromonas mediterranea TaxID=314275 RepID=UPI0012DB687A|nr:hypothetical protein [Alteromonas mediterranea]
MDTAFSLVVIIGLAAYVQAKTEPLTSKNDEAVIVDALTHIIEASKNYKAGVNDGFGSINMTLLSDAGLIPADLTTGTNPAGGSYTISNQSATGYSLNATQLGPQLCGRLTGKISRFADTSPSDCAAGTLTIAVN